MAKKKKDQNLKEMDVDELNQILTKNSQDLFKLRFRSASGSNKNVMAIRNLRKNIARIHTFLGQKRSPVK